MNFSQPDISHCDVNWCTNSDDRFTTNIIFRGQICIENNQHDGWILRLINCTLQRLLMFVYIYCRCWSAAVGKGNEMPPELSKQLLDLLQTQLDALNNKEGCIQAQVVEKESDLKLTTLDLTEEKVVVHKFLSLSSKVLKRSDQK